ncbi:Clp protease N-terminal domain-containing protein [Streptomyces sp. CWNU-52B]|uniref:Clp protease N-terminal domain-containing protein n=1 Tax=unclassified Streptomyces TaxID=2593676 RepID=UPI0039C161EF
MQHRIPHQQAAESGPVGPGGADIEAHLSAQLAAVVAGARRRALRDGDRQIDTAHLLHTLLESDPEVRETFESGPQVARLLGYLVQRSIGYGLRWQSSVEDSGAVPTVTVDATEGGWSPVAAGVMAAAYARAALRGDPHADGVDLLAALAAEPEARAVEVLGRAGIDVRELLARLDGAAERGVEA